jgi:peptidoglycan hydrolase CwlO-like protein
MRNPVIALGAATLFTVLVVALVLFAQISSLRAEVETLSSSVAGGTSNDAVLEEVRDLDARLDTLRTQFDEITIRFDRLDESIADLPTEVENRSQIETIVGEVRALQELLSGLSLDLGVVCDVIGC